MYGKSSKLKIARMKRLVPPISEQEPQLLSQLEDLAGVGIWEISLDSSSLYWSEGVYKIHELDPQTFTPTVEEAIRFYTTDSIPIITELVNTLINKGVEYDAELQLVTAKGRKIWVRVIGKAFYNEQGQISKVSGLFQDINKMKLRELAYQIHKKKVEAQNLRLQQFAHIVSHNLRSYTGNLDLMIRVLGGTTDEEERDTYWEQIKRVSASLNETIANLSEVVRVESEGRKSQLIRVKDAIDKVFLTLRLKLEEANAVVHVEMGGWEEIDFEPAYFDSILLNLLSNSTKYRDPERQLHIHVTTSVKAGKKQLTVKDNGRGIDLDRYGASLFGLYRTFHGNKDARGIGLFITKSQVESMGGKIWVESAPNVGASFHIEF